MPSTAGVLHGGCRWGTGRGPYVAHRVFFRSELLAVGERQLRSSGECVRGSLDRLLTRVVTGTRDDPCETRVDP